MSGQNVGIGPGGMLGGSNLNFQSDYSNVSMVNRGKLELYGQRFTVDGNRSANLILDGNFSQSSDAKLSVELTSDMKLDPSHTHASSAIVVRDTATIAGTLEVTLNGYAPDVGDRFAVILADELNGRFDRFEGSQIPDFSTADGGYLNDRFLGLNYRVTQRGAEYVSPVGSIGNVVEVVTLERLTE